MKKFVAFLKNYFLRNIATNHYTMRPQFVRLGSTAASATDTTARTARQLYKKHVLDDYLIRNIPNRQRFIEIVRPFVKGDADFANLANGNQATLANENQATLANDAKIIKLLQASKCDRFGIVNAIYYLEHFQDNQIDQKELADLITFLSFNNPKWNEKQLTLILKLIEKFNYTPTDFQMFKISEKLKSLHALNLPTSIALEKRFRRFQSQNYFVLNFSKLVETEINSNNLNQISQLLQIAKSYNIKITPPVLDEIINYLLNFVSDSHISNTIKDLIDEYKIGCSSAAINFVCLTKDEKLANEIIKQLQDTNTKADNSIKFKIYMAFGDISNSEKVLKEMLEFQLDDNDYKVLIDKFLNEGNLNQAVLVLDQLKNIKQNYSYYLKVIKQVLASSSGGELSEDELKIINKIIAGIRKFELNTCAKFEQFWETLSLYYFDYCSSANSSANSSAIAITPSQMKEILQRSAKIPPPFNSNPFIDSVKNLSVVNSHTSMARFLIILMKASHKGDADVFNYCVDQLKLRGFTHDDIQAHLV